MKFLLIGASGFIGRHTLAYIKSQGYEVIGTQTKAKYPELTVFDLLEHRIGDKIPHFFLSNDDCICGVILSSMCQIDRCFIEREISYKVNVEKTCQLIGDLQAMGIKSVYISSDAVYEGTDGYYSEEHQPNPINEYGRQKAEVEKYIQQSVPDSLILRLSKIVGEDPAENHLFTEWYKQIESGNPIVCIAGQVFSPTFVKDVAQSIVLSCEKKMSGLYNMANPVFFPREELAKQFGLALGKKVNIVCKEQEEFNFAERRTEKSYLDSTKFLKATGMQFTSMREVFMSFISKLEKYSLLR
jgi:dTDP-4-dehydrorhamnose reductase